MFIDNFDLTTSIILLLIKKIDLFESESQNKYTIQIY